MNPVDNVSVRTASLGIGIPTYNRAELLERVINGVRRHTSTPFSLVVADDGSNDDTESLLATLGVTCIRGRNMGVCWNKNRLLFYLTNILTCDIILLLEDDCCPTEGGWELDWLYAARQYGHINFAGSWFSRHFLGGSGLPNDPVESKAISGQCVGFSRQAIMRVGYFDTRFRGYGIGHIEHSWRMVRAGFGGRMDPSDVENPTYFLLRSCIAVEDDPSNRDDSSVARNQALLRDTRQEATHRWAWRNDEEMKQFLGEIDSATTQSKVRTPQSIAPTHEGSSSKSRRLGIAVSAGGDGAVLPLVERIRHLTASASDLVICDHGLWPAARKELQQASYRVIGGSQPGYAWNKNLGLFHLLHVCNCDVVILMDDCVWPVLQGWDLGWVDAAHRYGHINYCPGDQKGQLYGGRLTAEHPGVGPLPGGMIMAQTATAAACIGYMDPRFGLDPRAHTDFSLRFMRAGFGGFHYHGLERTEALFFMISGGAVVRHIADVVPPLTTGDLHTALKTESIFRLPWTSDTEAAAFRAQIVGDRAATPLANDFWAEGYLASNPDVARAKEDPLRHYITYGIEEGRPLGQLQA